MAGGPTEMNTHAPPLPGRRTTARSSGPPKPVLYAVQDLILGGVLTLMIAAGGTGKSLLALHLAISVSLCEPFLGHLTKQGRALYLEYELDPDIQQRNAALVAIGMGIAEDDPRLDDLVIYAPFNPLSTQAGIDELAEVIQREDPVVVIIDSLTVAVTGNDVNSQKEMAPALHALSRLGRTVVALDHTSKAVQNGMVAANPIGTVTA